MSHDLSDFLRTEARARQANDDGIWELLIAAADKIDTMHAQRLELDRRIHNQRRSNRENWEIVEQRRKWLGSQIARQSYVRMLKLWKESLAEITRLRANQPPPAPAAPGE